jgi:glycerol-3-phosphate acyltransferase PlsX
MLKCRTPLVAPSAMNLYCPTVFASSAGFTGARRSSRQKRVSMKVAVDAMGGDHAPDVVVQGALEAASTWGMEIILVGDRDVIGNKLGPQPRTTPIQVHHCGDMIHMNETPLKAVRRKKDASVVVAFDLCKKGEVDAVVSAGNSGATLAAAILTLGRVEGIERPALPGILPSENGNVILIDVGANVDCRPMHLFQFGIMADAFARSCMGMTKPKVGLLSIGEEGGKGNEQVRSAHDLFKNSPLNFVGNIEGRDIFTGHVQVIVCDGFVGNVALKLSEGMAEAIAKMLKQDMMRSFAGRAGFYIGRRMFRRFTERLDYAAYGGAPILGINGVGIVCHGGSSVKAIKNAIRMADDYAKNNFQDRISEQIVQYHQKVA